MKNIQARMNRYRKEIITASLFIMAVIFTTSCYTERIEIDLNDTNKKVVVSAWITDLAEPQIVKLSYSTNYFDNQTVAPITDATVKLKKQDVEIKLTQKEDGNYYLPDTWLAEYGQEYTLSIEVGNEKHEAKSILNNCPEIENLTVIDIPDEDEEDGFFTGLVFDFQESEGEGDGYFARDYKKGSQRKDSLSNGDFLSDDFLDGTYLQELSVTNKSFEKGDTAVIEIFSIGIEATKFLQDIQSEVFRGGLFDPPPVNIRTNISNGAIGYFIIGGAKRREIVVE